MKLSSFFGLAVRRHRQLLRLSQEELAARAVIDRTYISGVERGVRNPTLDVMERIAASLGVGLDVVFATARELSAQRENE